MACASAQCMLIRSFWNFCYLIAFCALMASCTLISRFVITLGIVCGVCGVLLKVEVRWLMIALYIGIAVCSFFNDVFISWTSPNVACVALVLVQYR